VPQLVRSIDMRYVGQNWELNVPMPGGELTKDDFDAAITLFEGEHERFYGYSIPGEELEMLTFNVAAVGTRHSVELPTIAPGTAPEPMLRRPVTFGVEDGPVDTPVYRRDDFGAGIEIAGPAVIGQTDATTLLPPGSSATVDDTGNLIITV
jgi:N-methylhydantoinase A